MTHENLTYPDSADIVTVHAIKIRMIDQEDAARELCETIEDLIGTEEPASWLVLLDALATEGLWLAPCTKSTGNVASEAFFRAVQEEAITR